MDTLKEFFAATRERVSSPFFGSFIFAWCVANWKIFIALAFFSREDYASVHTKNALEYIVSYLRKEHHFWWPLFIALAYTFGYPFFKAVIRAAKDFADVIGEKWNLQIVQNSKVDTSKFLRLRDQYLNKEKQLQKLIDEEETVRQNLAEAISDRVERDKKVAELELKLQQRDLISLEEKKMLNERLNEIQSYSIFDKVGKNIYQPANEKSEFIKGYSLSFTIDNDLRKILVLTPFNGDLTNRITWRVAELCCDYQRKSSLLICHQQQNHKASFNLSQMQKPILPFSFSIEVRQIDDPPSSLRIMLLDTLTTEVMVIVKK